MNVQKKTSFDQRMTMTEFEYHIYAKNEVLFQCLSEQDFQVRWQMLNSMVGPNSAVTKKDLSFTRVLAMNLPEGEEHSC